MHARQHYLGRVLAAAGHDVYVIAGREHHLMQDKPASLAAPRVEQIEGYTFVRIDTVTYANAHDKRRILSWLSFGWKIARLRSQLKLSKPEVILYSSPSLLGVLGAEWAARRAGAKLVFEVRDIWPLTLVQVGNINPRHPLIQVMQWVEDRAYAKADLVISNLKYAVAHMVTRGMDPAKFAWLPNGVMVSDTALMDPLPAATEAALPKASFIVGYAGTLGAAQDLHAFIDAAQLLSDHGDIAFVLVGDGKEKQNLKAQALGLGNVTFIDPIRKTQVQSMLTRFDACFIGLAPEPLFRFGVSPNKLFDYFMAEKPIIYAVDSGNYSPVMDHDAGVAVAPGTPQAIAQAVLDLADMPAARRVEMGANGRRALEAHYDYAALGAELDQMLRSLLDGQRAD